MIVSLLAATALLASGGCESGQPAARGPSATPKLAPWLERMRQTYEDLASGRFVSIADFETPGQEELFRCVGPDGTEGGRPQPTLSILRSRNETGAGGLKARLGGPGDQLRFDGMRSTKLALLRDWRPYHLLLMSIYGPPGGAALELAVESGAEVPVRWTQTVPVAPAWNLLRIDLATVGDLVDLGDVRALIWRAPRAAAPVELYLDDIVLADNTEYVLGAQAAPGELYVRRRGRRLQVGVRDRFELAFYDGLIVRWQSGSEENLVDVEGLGPWPIPLAENWLMQDPPIAANAPARFQDWGAAADASQRVVEATPFRVVLEGRRHFAAASNAPGDVESESVRSAGHAWRYAIYPGGQVYVQVQSIAPRSGWGAPRVGYALVLDGRRGFRHVPSPGALSRPEAQLVLLAREGPQRADLLWTWPRAVGLLKQRAETGEDPRRLTIIVGDHAADAEVATTHFLRLWPPDIDTLVEATSLARDYREPAGLRLHTGRLLVDRPGDEDGDGFNETEGFFELAPEGGVLRFELDPGPLPRFDPVFRVHDTAGRRAWVYARGRLADTLGRDVEDNLLFHLGRVSGPPLPLEVHAPGDGAAR